MNKLIPVIHGRKPADGRCHDINSMPCSATFDNRRINPQTHFASPNAVGRSLLMGHPNGLLERDEPVANPSEA